MITLSQLANKLNTELNALGLNIPFSKNNFQFKIYAETSNYKAPSRIANSVTTYLQGVLSEVSSDIENTSSGKVYGVYNTRLTLIIPILDVNPDEDLTYTLELLNSVRNVLDEWSAKNELFKIGKYAISTEPFAFETGVRAQRAGFGDSITLNGSKTFLVVEDGFNTKDVKFTIDNNPISFQNYQCYRTAIMESGVQSNNVLSSKNLVTATQINFKFSIPADTDAVTQMLFNYITVGNDNNHVLKLYRNNIEVASYNVVIAEVTEVGAGATNVGLTFTLAEKLIV